MDFDQWSNLDNLYKLNQLNKQQQERNQRAGSSSQANSPELREIKRLLEEQKAEQQRKDQLPKCPECASPLERDVRICAACKSKITWYSFLGRNVALSPDTASNRLTEVAEAINKDADREARLVLAGLSSMRSLAKDFDALCEKLGYDSDAARRSINQTRQISQSNKNAESQCLILEGQLATPNERETFPFEQRLAWILGAGGCFLISLVIGFAEITTQDQLTGSVAIGFMFSVPTGILFLIALASLIDWKKQKAAASEGEVKRKESIQESILDLRKKVISISEGEKHLEQRHTQYSEIETNLKGHWHAMMNQLSSLSEVLVFAKGQGFKLGGMQQSPDEFGKLIDDHVRVAKLSFDIFDKQALVNIDEASSVVRRQWGFTRSESL